MAKNYTKYQPFKPLDMPERKWPNKVITKAPVWCSVDLRDGNQSLVTPMSTEQKLEFFKFLVGMGFKEIEVGFPAAADTEFKFVRRLIEEDLIPDDVTIQVLTQSRRHIIERTFEAVAGAKRVIVHLYNSTSTLQRDVVFNTDMDGVKEIAVTGAKLCAELAEKYGKERFLFEYSPESFTGTEMQFAVEICQSVLDILIPVVHNKVIINLPSTVEMTTPNVYADQIEYVCGALKNRDDVIISLHAHNDRGCAVAATELGIMAGADRVEGTLFGNGERTGNADILTLAMNMYSQGIDCGLDFSSIDEAVAIYEKSTGLTVHPRHPYAGSLVYTAFSGSHQDAINKGLARMKEHPDKWEVPYLPVDPADVGRSYAPIIRINSQSGKGGVAFILETNFGLSVPKLMRQHFGQIVTNVSDEGKKELVPQEIYDLFIAEYVNIEVPLSLVSYSEKTYGDTNVTSVVNYKGMEQTISASGSGLMDAFSKSVSQIVGRNFEIINYHEHSMEYGSRSRAITYVAITCDDDEIYFGAGVSSSISKSSLRAVVSAVDKMLAGKKN